MKKNLVRVVLAVIVAILIAWIWYSTRLPRQRPAADIQVELTAENIERGRYLAVNVLHLVGVFQILRDSGAAFGDVINH